ncbi:MAG TPA: hypothetical protein VE869_05520 [Gemmatimonas sp.]|nr:hypothetical protein [Gemmatimonas sp.]
MSTGKNDGVMPTPEPPAPAVGVDRTMLIAGVAQLVAATTTAANVRFAPDRAFHELPSAGVALLVLGTLTVVVAVRPRGLWRWMPGACSLLVLAVAFWRLQWAPTTSFADPLLQHAVGPAWGFMPMVGAVALGLVGATRRR